MVEPAGRLARHLRHRLDGDRGVGGLRAAAGRVADDVPPGDGVVGRRRLDRHGAGRLVRRPSRTPPTAPTRRAPARRRWKYWPPSRRSSSSPACWSAVAWVLDTAIAGLGGGQLDRGRRRLRRPAITAPAGRSPARAASAALLLMAARVDINDFSLNAFYRNRLVRCYLGATRFAPGERHPQNFTGFDDDDDLALTALAGIAGTVAHRELHPEPRRVERPGAAHPPQRRVHADAAGLRQPLLLARADRRSARARLRPDRRLRRRDRRSGRRFRCPARRPAPTWAITPRRSSPSC